MDFDDDWVKILRGLYRQFPPRYFGYLPLPIRIVYPACELPIEGVTANIIFNKMKNPHKTLVTKQNLMETLRKHQNTEGYAFDVVMTLGAGDIDTFVKPIKELLS